MNNSNFAFFGTDNFSLITLEELKNSGFLPSVVICAPDRPKGRGLVLTPPQTKIWAENNGIKVLQPEKLNSDFISELTNINTEYNFFVVSSYGKIIPQAVLDIPKLGTLNVHPSLLPKYRGASPIESQILNNESNIGVSIIILDSEMDHGPILASQEITIDKIEDKKYSKLSKTLASEGGKLLCDVIPKFVSREITGENQDHSKATFTKKITKTDGEIKLNDNALTNYLKFLAFDTWPETYFFATKGGANIRVKIKDAELQNDTFVIKKVVPEGGKEMSFDDFKRGVSI